MVSNNQLFNLQSSTSIVEDVSKGGIGISKGHYHGLNMLDIDIWEPCKWINCDSTIQRWLALFMTIWEYGRQ